MIRIKKEVQLLCILLFLISLSSAYADEVGCCSNSGAGLLTCSTLRLALRDKECCPKPESSFPAYYKSQQNPDSPQNSNDCAASFFSPNKACSTVEVCALGCCCSELGGTIASAAQCKGTGLTFNKGQTNCNQVCPVPECNDGFDNDNNGCGDFEGGDLGCTSPADKTESGGSCIKEGVGCSNSAYIPKLSSLEIAPVKGQRKFLLKWKDECSETAVSYDVLRCKESGCTNFALVGTTNINSFEDTSGDLMFDTAYTYQIKARYNLQAANPTISKTAALGNIECLDRISSANFCIHDSYYDNYKNYLLTNFPLEFKNFASGVKTKFGEKLNKAFFCDPANKLVAEGTSCSSTQICVINNNKPSCLSKVNCNYNSANPFGLFYTQQDCEADRYCFYDRSHSTVNSCFGCEPSMACYDYKTESACARDNCRAGNCKWKDLSTQIEVGACISTAEYNCQWCEKKGTASLENLRAFNEIFDFCTREKSSALSEASYKCYFRNGKSKNCEDVICKDYEIDECSSAQITFDENNKIKNPSTDECGIRVCQNINGACAKNADGDSVADCSTQSCEADYFPPNTTILPLIRKGVVDSLFIQIYDKTGTNGSTILKLSEDYTTFLCAEPCISNSHPYNSSMTSRTLIISNLNAFDGSNGNRISELNEGVNTLRYYSQDPAKNIGEVKKISIEAHENTDGPLILEVNITDGSNILGKLYTSNQKPAIAVKFFEPAVITHSRLINKKIGLIVPLNSETDPSISSTSFSFQLREILPNGEYIFELNGNNRNNIFMDPPLSQIIIIDNVKPVLEILPAAGSIINVSFVAIKLTFDKEVTLEGVKINNNEIKDSFSTTDNKVFTAALNMTDGNKNLEVAAGDFAKNKIRSSISFIVDANPAVISLASPKFGAAPKSIFDLVVETDNNAACRFSLDNNFEFDFMEPFASTGGTMHKVPNFNKIPAGDVGMHKLNVRCKDSKGISFKSFDINVDTTLPQIKSAFAFPNPVIEKPSTTTLNIESDEPVICRYSNSPKDFDKMDNSFEGFESNNFKLINKQPITPESEGNYVYSIACKNKAGLVSEIKEIAFKVDLTIPVSITPHTPEFFNSTSILLAISSNKKSQCTYSETDPTAKNGEIFGAPGYSHTRQLVLATGKHRFYAVCKDQFLQAFSDVLSIDFTIDITPPIILSVNDSSTLAEKPDLTFSTDHLRVRWNSIENESRIGSHFYSIIESGTQKVILNTTQSSANNEWVIASKPNSMGLGLINGNRYYFRVRAQNVVGLLSNISESDGITIDASLKPLNCSNGIKDEKETDLDCGGGCEFCGIGKKCASNADCKTNFCNNGICSAPKCDDNVKNQEESDLDCGGPCKKCQNSQVCGNSNDCESGFCSFGFCKPQEACLDGKLSPGESDADCGGTCQTKCSDGKSCNVNEDCGEELQCISSECKRCSDNDKNCNGIPDEQEDKTVKDSDNDGLPDDWEIKNDLNPNDANDAAADSDNDGLTNLEEYNLAKTYRKSTDPNLADTDGDKFDDKEEIDNNTSPVDPEDFPKSNFAKSIITILVILVLLSGIGYLGYRMVQKRKIGPVTVPRSMQIPKTAVQQQRQPFPLRQKEDMLIKEALRKKEEQKEKDRQKLFEPFGVQKPKAEAKPEIKKEQKETKEIKKKAPNKVPKEDVFSRLSKISKDRKQARQRSQQKPKDKLQRLYELAKYKKKK